ncbi:hypothetical protein [Cyclobacterium jeungdonense]|uniref:Uncharacterized protein n=1 Tax=Cyclobacterium jeungdonense TaxID=708087 RepID=A0ABT8C8M7_9BACT|nr:hypothetical protein [Cyclobacterium jeungdonense]MDN3688379.1 hypothetical protein [Cyclobacterium jeungdonense]
MRVVNEVKKEEVKITLFDWNNKYLIKFETGGMEQTFKISALDVPEEKSLELMLEGEFFEDVKERFNEMHQSLQKAMKNF